MSCALRHSIPSLREKGKRKLLGFVLGFHTPASVSQPVFPKPRCKVWGGWVSSQHASVESRLWTTRSFTFPCLLPVPSSAHALLQILSPIRGLPPPPRRYPLASESRTKTPKGGLQAGAASSGAVESGAPCPSPSCCVPEAAGLQPNGHHDHAWPRSGHGELLVRPASSARLRRGFERLPPVGRGARSHHCLPVAGGRPRSASPARAPPPPPGQLRAQS